MDGKIRGALTVASGLGALITGYLWGFGVGEREGQDSDSDEGHLERLEDGSYYAHGGVEATIQGERWESNGG